MKKLLSLIMAAIMTVVMIVPVSAAGTDSALKSAITVAKQRVTVPGEYTQFDYDSYSDSGVKYYNLHWFPEDRSASLYVLVSGKIIYTVENYSNSTSNGDKPTFGEKSRSQLISAAKKQLKALNPTIYKKLVIDEDSFVSSLYGDYATIHFDRYENGIKVYNNDGTVTLDKNTGELKGFRLNWCTGLTFADPETAISLEEAEKAFSTEYIIEPVYRLFPNYDEQKYDVSLLYIQKNRGDLDAFTGKLSDFNANFYGTGFWDEECDDSVEEDSNDAGKFTEEEMKSIEANNKLKTVEELEEIIKNNAEIIFTDDISLKSYQLTHDLFDEDTYVWELRYSNKSWSRYLNITFDAQTGKIRSFSQNAESKAIPASQFGTAAAKKKAAAFAKAEMGSKKFAKYKFTSCELESYVDGKTGVEYANNCYVIYDRYENGVRVEGDSITVTLNSDNVITGYYSDYTKATFEKKEYISAEKAFERLFEQTEPTISYKCNIDYSDKKFTRTSALLYSLEAFTLDAVTGDMVNYFGTALEKNTKTYGGYTDIKDKDLKKIAELLEDYGVALPTSDGKLYPDKAITEADFIELLGKLNMWCDYEDGKTAKSITRQDALKYMVSARYGSEVAELKGIFKSPFSDLKDSSKYVGYAAIAYAKGIVSGEKLNPTDKLTKADALRWAYNYIINS